jgi:hypothetical protein
MMWYGATDENIEVDIVYTVVCAALKAEEIVLLVMVRCQLPVGSMRSSEVLKHSHVISRGYRVRM